MTGTITQAAAAAMSDSALDDAYANAFDNEKRLAELYKTNPAIKSLVLDAAVDAQITEQEIVRRLGNAVGMFGGLWGWASGSAARFPKYDQRGKFHPSVEAVTSVQQSTNDLIASVKPAGYGLGAILALAALVLILIKVQ